MTMRTPNPWNNLRSTTDLQRIKERLSIAQLQVATGKRIVRLGDDPTGAALVVDFNNSISQNEQYLKQADSALSFLRLSESAMDSMNTSLTRLLELGQQGLSDITGALGRPKIAMEVDGIRTNIISVANTQEQGKYIFAGTRTTTVPFVDNGAAVTYAGDSGLINLSLGVTASVVTNLTGDSAFFGPSGAGSGTDLFQQVTSMRDALKNNDTAGIKSAYENLKTIHSRLQDSLTDLGGRMAAVDQLKETVGNFNTSLHSIQDVYAAVDYPTAIMNFQKEMTAQETSLSALSKANKTNLFDYLG